MLMDTLCRLWRSYDYTCTPNSTRATKFNIKRPFVEISFFIGFIFPPSSLMYTLNLIIWINWDYILSSLAESLAYKETLSWLKDRGMLLVELFMDCSNLQHYLSSSRIDVFYYVGFSISGCRDIMSSFTHCLVSLVPRSSNLIAHALATMAYPQANTLYWKSGTLSLLTLFLLYYSNLSGAFVFKKIYEIHFSTFNFIYLFFVYAIIIWWFLIGWVHHRIKLISENEYKNSIIELIGL